MEAEGCEQIAALTLHPLSTSLEAGIIVPTVQQELWKGPAKGPIVPTKGGKEVK